MDSMRLKGSMLASGWRDMDTAPRDGTVVELVCLYGVAPWYRLHQWTRKYSVRSIRCLSDGTQVDEGMHEGEGEPAWRGVPDSSRSVDNERYLLWRPTAQTGETYRDPTGGAQDSSDYWIRACGLNPANYPNRPNPAPNAPHSSWRQRLFA